MTTTATTLEPTTIEALRLEPQCEGRNIGEGETWVHFECPNGAEIARIKKCGCVVLQCMACRNSTKRAIESAIAKLGWRNFFCTLCATIHQGATSYWDMIIREVPL
jgi:predicted RNA-binding Zn-ribbon protein involved in translation (DUF1610 family)